MNSEPVYEQTVRIDAPPETVFDLFSSAEAMARWIGVTHEVDCRPGGVMRVDVTDGDIAVGTFEVVDRPHRVVFTWGWEASTDVPPGSSTVEVSLRPEGAGTVLDFTHSGLPASAVESHGDGWRHYLERLAVATTGDPGPDPWVNTPTEDT